MYLLRLQVVFFTFLISAAISIYSIYSSYYSNIDLIETAKKRELQVVTNMIQYDMLEQLRNDASRATLIANLPPVIQAFRDQNREELQKLVLPIMENQRKRFRIWDSEFDLPPATAFLRPFKPDKFGDDVSSSSEMVLQTNKLGEPQEGVEIVSSGIGMRGTAVVKDQKGLIGSFVVAIDMNYILNSIKKATGFDVGVLIDNDLWKETVTNKDAADPEAKVIGGLLQILISGSVRGQKRDWKNITPVLVPTLFTELTNITQKFTTVNGVEYGYTVIPLLDFKGLEIGAIIATKNFSYYQNDLRDIQLKSLIYGSIQTAFLTLAVYLLLNFILVRRVHATNLKLKGFQQDLEQGKTIAKNALLGVTREIYRTVNNWAVVLIIVIFSVCASATIGSVLFRDSLFIIKDAERRELGSLNNSIEMYLGNQADEAAAKASILSSFPPVQQEFANKNQEALLGLLRQTLKIQQERFSIRQAIFYLPPATQFLNIFRPTQSGSDDSSFNNMVVKSNTEHQPQQGIALTRTGLSMQAVDPISYNNEFVGSIEISTDFSRLIPYIKGIANYETAIFIEKEPFQKVATEAGVIEQDRFVGNYISTSSSNWQKISPFTKGYILTKRNQTTYHLVGKKGVDHGILTIPLMDHNKQNIGVILSIANFDFYKNHIWTAFVHCFANISIQIIALVGLILLLFQSYFFGPVSYLNDLLIDLAEGKPPGKILYQHYTGCIGDLARLVASLQKQIESSGKGISP